MNKQEILKTAATSLRALSDRIEQLETEKDVFSKAMEITTGLVKNGQLSPSGALEKLAELQNSSVDDLITLDKAIELTKESEFQVSLGTVADSHSKDGDDPLTSFLLDN
jgi:hypothetical protein